ncbi:MAG: class II aldolase/adducin family protein [Candidatus Coatesbacteria bacterium]|nr:class II aldolase/adducin family protein [Candidatus Coatesbacteria bacterium]
MNRNKAVRDIVSIGKRLYEKGMVASNDGNLSVKINKNEIAITPTGICKGDMAASDILIVDMKSRKVISGKKKITSEAPMHFSIYEERNDAIAVVHAHPVVATALAVAGVQLDSCILPEIVLTIGIIPLADYATPSTSEVPESIKNYIKKHDVVLLANHGAISIGKDLWDAYFKMERLEHYAQIFLVSKLLGSQRILTSDEVCKLQMLSPEKPIECKSCSVDSKVENSEADEKLTQVFRSLLNKKQ